VQNLTGPMDYELNCVRIAKGFGLRPLSATVSH
jgi:hypothetical protein